MKIYCKYCMNLSFDLPSNKLSFSKNGFEIKIDKDNAINKNFCLNKIDKHKKSSNHIKCEKFQFLNEQNLL